MKILLRDGRIGTVNEIRVGDIVEVCFMDENGNKVYDIGKVIRNTRKLKKGSKMMLARLKGE